MQPAETLREGGGSAVRRVPDVRRSRDARGEPADGDDLPSSHQGDEKAMRLRDLGSRREAIRGRGPRMRRHDVPEQQVLLEPEVGEHTVDDRRGRLRGPRSGELPLGREGEAADAGAAIAGRLADEEERGAASALEVGAEPFASERRVGVLVVGGADPRGGELLDESLEGYSHSIVEGGFDETSSATRFTPGISLMIRLEIVSSRSYGRRAQSAVMASSLVTARMTIG